MLIEGMGVSGATQRTSSVDIFSFLSVRRSREYRPRSLTETVNGSPAFP